MIRIRYQIDIGISSNYSEERDIGRGHIEVINDNQNDGGAWKMTLTSGATNVLAQTGNLSAINMIIIRTSVSDPTQLAGNVLVQLNSLSGPQVTIQPMATYNPKEGMFAITTNGVSAIYLSNPSAVSMDCTIYAAGD